MKKLFLFFLLIHLSPLGVFAQVKKYIFYADKMGSPFTTSVISNDSAKTAFTYQKGLLLVDSLVHIISDYDDSSELNKLNASAGIKPIAISPYLEKILLAGKSAYATTHGQYSIAIGSLSLLWREARKTHTFPNPKLVAKAKEHISCDDLLIDTLKHTAFLRYAGMHIDLGSLGKGYIAQSMINYYKQEGFENCMIDAGGKIVASKALDEKYFWHVGIQLPRNKNKMASAIIRIENGAIASSGDAFQYIQNKGKRYSHIIDTKTGYGITSPKNVTVIANEGILADWLSTACSLMPISKAIQLAQQHNAQIYIAILKGSKVEIYKSKGFDAYCKEKM